MANIRDSHACERSLANSASIGNVLLMAKFYPRHHQTTLNRSVRRHLSGTAKNLSKYVSSQAAAC